VSILDVASGGRIGSLPSRSNEPIEAIALSPDGATLAMTAGGSAVSLWDVATNLEVGTLDGGFGAVRSLSFAGDGSLVAGSDNGGILVWPVGTEAMRDRACRIANRNLTLVEWQEFVPDEPYRATCHTLPVDGTVPPAVAGGSAGTVVQ
jgi:WD40 repeat protein